MKVGVLHSGSMGAALASNARGDVYWASNGRSQATAARARDAGMVDLESLQELVERVDTIISVCPPDAAVEVARDVSRLGFEGIYIDANAVSPATSLEIADMFARFVDGGIVGTPPHPPGTTASTKTRLYLSGEEAGIVVGIFAGSNVDPRALGQAPGSASALKVAYAAWTKGSAALLLSLVAYARSQGVLADLIHEWEGSIHHLPGRLESVASSIGRKAWRFEGEMEQIAAAFADSDLPDGFHTSAAEVYARLAELKDHADPETMDEIVDLIVGRHS